MPAEGVAEQVVAVINRSVLPPAPCCTGQLAARCCAVGGRLYGALYRALCPAAARRVAPGSSGGGAAGGEGAPAAAPVWQPRPPPNWFLAGGAARAYFLLGVLQKLAPGGWPANALFAKRFGCDRSIEAARP